MSKSVLHDWICELPIRMQALLCVALRGPDGMQKESSAKCLLRLMRGVVLKPSDPSYCGNGDSFMWTDYRQDLLEDEDKISFKIAEVELNVFDHNMNEFWNNHDHYPHHFIMHLIHAAEVISYKHPDGSIRGAWSMFYTLACNSFHMNVETEEQMDNRLS